jgi:hypothetical protein
MQITVNNKAGIIPRTILQAARLGIALNIKVNQVRSDLTARVRNLTPFTREIGESNV